MPAKSDTKAASSVWPDEKHLSRATFMAPDYTTALGAFLFLERIEGREKLQGIIRRLVARHKFQGPSFYRDLKKEIGFDIRKVTTSQIAGTLKSDQLSDPCNEDVKAAGGS